MRIQNNIFTNINMSCQYREQTYDYLERGICRRSKKVVHRLKTILFDPVDRKLSRSFKSANTLDDSTQFLLTSTRNRLSVGAVISSCLLTDFLPNKDIVALS